MKQSLKQFAPVLKALEQIQLSAITGDDNGTFGQEFLCHFWDVENNWDKAREENLLEQTRALLAGKMDKVKELQEEAEKLPPTKRTLMFKLVNPIPILRGTKKIIDGNKVLNPIIHDVSIIHIAEDLVDLGVLEFEETTDVGYSKNGSESPIIKLQLSKCILDVKEAKLGWDDKEKSPAKANVTIISYKSMQTAGAIINNELRRNRKVYGWE